MQRSVRNLGRSGLAACAISAIDAALWDLKAQASRRAARDAARPLPRCASRSMAAAGSPPIRMSSLREQLAGWVERDGCRFVKMKIGSEPERDPRACQAGAKRRSASTRCLSTPTALSPSKQALDFAERRRDADIRWFEEPVTSDDLPGLRLMRERAAGHGDRRRRIHLQPR